MARSRKPRKKGGRIVVTGADVDQPETLRIHPTERAQLEVDRAKFKEVLEVEARRLAVFLHEELLEDLLFSLFVYRADGETKFITDGSLEQAALVVDRWRSKISEGGIPNAPDSAEAAALRRLRFWLVTMEDGDSSIRPEDPDAIVNGVIDRIRFLHYRYRKDVPPGRRIIS